MICNERGRDGSSEGSVWVQQNDLLLISGLGQMLKNIKIEFYSILLNLLVVSVV